MDQQANTGRVRYGRKIGEVLVGMGYVTMSQLNVALQYQREKGGRLGWVLANLGYINRLELYTGLARHLELPFEADMSVVKNGIDRGLLSSMTHEEAILYQAIPFHLEQGKLSIVTAEPGNEETIEFFKARFRVREISEIVITDLDLVKLCQELCKEPILDKTINGLFYRSPDQSAIRLLSRRQWVSLAFVIAALGFWAYLNLLSLIIAAFCLVQISYIAVVLFKLAVTIASFRKKREEPATGAELRALEPKSLPTYTILIPVYKEERIIKTLVSSIEHMDYPADKLDIIILMEEGDEATLTAIRREKPPVNWRFIILPDSLPRTKPKALNYGLHFARGRYLTIYDAEDIPQPDQLKRAVVAFRKHPDEYVCFQAALNYFNGNENFLTRMFTLEYSHWFDILIPGLYKLGLPIPLGGTSNHFDVQKLKQLGGWDPFNVTEDADLGIRASAEGYKVGMLYSTTYEEANSKLGNWLRQRSRWVKGYMQTFLVYSRHPIQAIKSMGVWQWLAYNILVGGTPANFLVNPVMWGIFAYSLSASESTFDIYFSFPLLFYLSLFNLVLCNGIVIALNMVGVVPRKSRYLLPWAILTPVYWLLQSVGSYKALWQLVMKPHYWEKTHHGITRFHPSLSP
jgi:cellulose synthase/poly-beta-1,6-N-acetylglucosamine synthase-like glycosyltransferase